MREIKFRAWLINGNRMVSVSSVDTLNHAIIHSDHKTDYAAYILMQYTGLKDKNGKKIYEGDIVQSPALFDSVIYEGGVFTLTRSMEIFGIKQPLGVHQELEVIGNIYENPELLK